MTDNGRWTVDSMPEVTGTVAIVTGADSGIGYETARALVAIGGRVIMACRSMEKGHAALEKIRAEHPDGDVEFMELDLADLSSVRPFVEEFLSSHDQLHIRQNLGHEADHKEHVRVQVHGHPKHHRNDHRHGWLRVELQLQLMQSLVMQADLRCQNWRWATQRRNSSQAGCL